MKVKKIRVRVPESFDEISLRKFQLMQEILESKTDDLDKSFQLIQILTNMNLDDILRLDEYSMVLIGESVKEIFTAKYSGITDNKYKDSKPIDFEKMTLGKFVDLHQLLDDKIGNAQKILCHYFDTQEKYNGMDYANESKYDDYMTSNYLIIYDKIANFYHSVLTDYGMLGEPMQQGNQLPKSTQQAFNEKWGYYILIANLAGNDVLKLDAVTNLPFREAFTFNAYISDYNKLNN